MPAIWTQTFPPSPALTEETCPSLTGKVALVTGATSGCGFDLARILYSKGAKVYITARTNEKGTKAVDEIDGAIRGDDKGVLEYLELDYTDLTGVRACADAFKARESHLDLLFHNAGVSTGGKVVTKSAQGVEMHLAVNALGPFLLTQHLLPEIKAAPHARVTWSSSMLVDAMPIAGGLDLKELDNPTTDAARNYTISKVGNWLLASEFGRRVNTNDPKIVISLAVNPGNLQTNIMRNQPWILRMMVAPLMKPSVNGAYTMLYAAVSEDLTAEHNGAFIIPFGRLHPSPRQDMLEALKAKEDGGTGVAVEFWEWCASKCQLYLPL